jgi:hypothetical protein
VALGSGVGYSSFQLTYLEAPMPLSTVVITLIVIGVLLWLINTYNPMDGKIKQIINVVVVVVTVLWLLNVFGVINHGEIKIPTIQTTN